MTTKPNRPRPRFRLAPETIQVWHNGKLVIELPYNTQNKRIAEAIVAMLNAQ
jgi:hypothetical protein